VANFSGIWPLHISTKCTPADAACGFRLILWNSVPITGVSMPNNISDTFTFPPPTSEQKIREYDLWATHYYAYHAKATKTGIPLLDKDGNELGPKVSKKDWCKAAVEATIIVEDGTGAKTVYNYAAKPQTIQVDCSRYTPRFPEGRIRYQLARGPFGDGVDHDGDGIRMVLVPFRTMAVAPAASGIPYRTLIYVPDARGLPFTLPSGESKTHDGYFFAGDTGTAMDGRHVDIFGGDSPANPFPNFIKNQPEGGFQAYSIQNSSIAEELASLHDNLNG